MDQDFFKNEVATHYNSVRSYLLSYLHDADTASDLAQDCMLKAYELFIKNQYKEKKALKNWLFCMAYSKLIDYYRRQSSLNKKLKDNKLCICNSLGWAEEQIYYNELGANENKVENYTTFARNILYNRFENIPLSVSQRKVMQMRYINRFSYKEIAQMLQEPLSTIISRHVYSMKIIRGLYAKQEFQILKYELSGRE